MNNGLSLLKIINGLSKTLTIAKEVIPLYKQVKPIISNSGKLLNNINKLNSYGRNEKTRQTRSV